VRVVADRLAGRQALRSGLAADLNSETKPTPAITVPTNFFGIVGPVRGKQRVPTPNHRARGEGEPKPDTESEPR